VKEIDIEADEPISLERTLFTIAELTSVLPGAPIHADTIRRCIRKNRLKPQGLGFRNAKLYRIQQFELVFRRNAIASESGAQENKKQESSPFTKVVARRGKSKKAS